MLVFLLFVCDYCLWVGWWGCGVFGYVVFRWLVLRFVVFGLVLYSLIFAGLHFPRVVSVMVAFRYRSFYWLLCLFCFRWLILV